jgi:hypothetical protein
VETGARGFGNIKRLLEHDYDWILSFSVTEDVEARTRRELRSSDVTVNHVLFAKPADYERKIGVLDKDPRASD